MQCKVRIEKGLEGVWPEYQPDIGKIYDADYTPAKRNEKRSMNREFCVVDIKDKRIVLRRGEFEIVE